MSRNGIPGLCLESFEGAGTGLLRFLFEATIPKEEQQSDMEWDTAIPCALASVGSPSRQKAGPFRRVRCRMGLRGGG